MDQLFPLLGAICFVGVCLLVVAGIIVLTLVLARAYGKATDRNWQQVADDLGLTYGRDEATNPFIEGRLHDVEVWVGTNRTTRTVFGVESSHRKPMIWTRVVARPSSPPSFEAWLRSNKAPQPAGLCEVETGDPEFDGRYRLFAPEDRVVDVVCPPAVRDVMLRTPRDVQVVDHSVIWSNGFIEHNKARLTAALDSCAQVAKAIDDLARDDQKTGG